MKKYFVLYILLLSSMLSLGQAVETTSIGELPLKDSIVGTDMFFVEDDSAYNYHTTANELLGWMRDSISSSIPMTATTTNYTSTSGSESVAFVDLNIWNDTLFLGSATTRSGDQIYVARTDYTNSVVITGTPGIYYKSTGYTTFFLSKTMTGAILQSDGSAWYIIGVFYDYYTTPTHLIFPDSVEFSGVVLGNTYQKSNIITVGSNNEQYSVFYTAVTAATASQVIELSAGTYSVSVATVTMPRNSTLKVSEGGMLTGTFNLVGDSTRLVAGLTKIFDDNVTLSGTWIVDEVYSDWFGLNESGSQTAKFNKLMAFAGITTGKKVVFGNKTYSFATQPADIYGSISIDGNHATFVATDSACAYMIRYSGSAGSWDTLSLDIAKGSFFMEADLGSTLLDLTPGDLVKIISNYKVDAIYNNGEMKKVNKVIGNIVYFTQPFFDSYLVADVVRAQQVNPIEPQIRNLNLIQTGEADWSFGIYFGRCQDVVCENVFVGKAKYASYAFYDCYSPKLLHCSSSNDYYTGTGYGASIYGATTNPIIDGCNFCYCRHAVAHGGDGSGGYPWNSLVTNTTGTSFGYSVFDAHESTGSVIWENCTAIAGMPEQDTTHYKGLWDDGVAYSIDDIVLFHKTLFKAKRPGTNIPPDTITVDYNVSPYWGLYSNSLIAHTAWTLRCSNITIRNCQVYNAYTAVQNSVDTLENIIIDGLTCYNVPIAILLSTYPVYNSSIDNVVQINDQAFKSNYLLSLNNTSIDQSLQIGSLETNNGRGLYVWNTTTTSFINIQKLSCNRAALYVQPGTMTSPPDIRIGKLITKGDNVNINCMETWANLKSLVIDDWHANSVKSKIADLGADIDYFRIGNLVINNTESVSQAIYVRDTIDVFEIGSVYATGTGAYPLVTNFGVVTNATVGNWENTSISDLFSNKEPTNLYVIHDFMNTADDDLDLANFNLNNVDVATIEDLNMTSPVTWMENFRLRPFYYADWLYYGPSANDPWTGAGVASGTIGGPAGGTSVNHPGIGRFVSSTTTNSGYRFYAESNVIIGVHGGEITNVIIRFSVLDSITTRFGFHDATTSTAPVDGVYFEIGPDSVLWGKTMSSSSGSTTGTSYLCALNTWYRLKIVVNSTATQVDYYLINESGTVLWTDFLTTNIPTGATGHGVICTKEHTGSGAGINLLHIDYMDLYLGPLIR